MKKITCFGILVLFVFVLVSCSGLVTPPSIGDSVQGGPALPGATAGNAAREVYSYLASVWGKKTLAGQMDLAWVDGVDMAARVHGDTGKYPALMGYDFMDMAEGDNQEAEALAWHQAKGLLTFCWHWRDPGNAASYAKFYSSETSFRIPMTPQGTLDTGSAAFSAIKADLDLVASKLQWLQARGVPVLWRPLHEGAGGWFWWGGNRSDGLAPAVAYKALWVYMYDYLGKTKGLDNLLWVFNGQDAAWYPGDAFVDIIGEDVYSDATARDYGSQKARFDKARAYTGSGKMLALTENGPMPKPENMTADSARWLWFMTWNDKDQDPTNRTGKDEYFWSSSYYNDLSHRQFVYGHDLVITRDELPLSLFD